MRFSRSALVFAGCSGLGQAVTFGDAEASFNALQQWYNQSIGLWIPSTGWWNSANCLTVIADLAMIDPEIKQQASSIWTNTFTQAQHYNLAMQKSIGANFEPSSYYSDHWPHFPPNMPKPPGRKMNGFLNDYYDDEGWWALAWIAVFDTTGDPHYLATAESIFDDMVKAYNTTPCGGLWWDKANTYVNAIANELFFDVAAHLAVRSWQNPKYLTFAKEQWTWFQNSGLINAENTINDGLNLTTCENNNGTVWSYNQGVLLGALTQLSRATRDLSYITTAKSIADAAIAHLADANNILHDPCEPDCGGDGSQFKGVFVRNLQILQLASPETRFKSFLDANAESVWESDRSGRGELGVVWTGGGGVANASTQSSGMDALVGSLGT